MICPTLLPLSPGERIAYFVILAHVAGERAQDQVYRVRRTCCGTVHTITYKRMMDHKREQHVECLGCRTVGRPTDTTAWVPGEVVGALTLLERAKPPKWLVQWAFCGLFAELGVQTIKNYRRNGKVLCPACSRELVATAPAVEPVAVVDVAVRPADLNLYAHLWQRPVPIVIRRDVWGHPAGVGV